MTPLAVTKKALHAFVLGVPSVQDMAASAEALRMLSENKGEASALFSPCEQDIPATDKQVRYLRYLGYRGEIRTRRQATTLIMDLKSR